MGAYLFFKAVNQQEAEAINQFILQYRESKPHLSLEAFDIGLYSEVDIEWAKSENPRLIQYMIEQHGTGSWKASGLGYPEHIYAGIAEIFEALHSEFKIKILCRSCALSENYFSALQISKITNKGKALSGQTQYPEDFQEILEIIARSP